MGRAHKREDQPLIAKFQHKSIDDIFLFASHFLDHFMMLIFAKAAYDAGLYFGIGYEEIIGYGTLSFVLFGACAPIAARLSDSYSRSLMMVVFNFGIGLAAIFSALAQSPLQLMLGLAVLGAFAAIYHPVGISMLLKSDKRIGLRLGINGVFGNLGVAAAPVFIGAILLNGDWRMGFWVSGVLCLIYGVLFASRLRHEPGAKASAQAQKGTSGFSTGWQRALIALALVTTSGGFIFGAMTFLVPRYFDLALGGISSSVAVTGALASLVYACASGSQVLVGWLVDRVSPKHILLATAAGQVVFIYVSSSLADIGLLVMMTCAMCFVFGQIPLTDAIMSRYVPDEYRTRVLSIKFLLNLTAGATVLPLCGFMLQRGYTMADLFSFISFLAIPTVCAALLLPRQSRMMQPQTP